MGHGHKEDSRPNPKALGAIALAAAALCLLALMAMRGGLTKDAGLRVEVTPANASVRIARLEIGAQSLSTAEWPKQAAEKGVVTFERLPRDAKVTVVATAEGFSQSVASATLKPPTKEDPYTVVKIKLAPQQGIVTVLTEPEGATVYLRNKSHGKSPALFYDLDPGTYTFEARLTGYEPTTKTTRVEAGGNSQIMIELVELAPVDVADAGVEETADDIPPKMGRVIATATHTSRWFFDNYIIGLGKKIVKNVPMGEHVVGARAEGRASDYKRVDVPEGGIVRVNFDFSEDPIEKAYDAMDKTKPLHWVVRGGGLRNGGQWGKSVDFFKTALELDENYPMAHWNLARTLPGLKRWDEAIYHTEKYLELNPDAPDAKDLKAMIPIYERKKLEEETGEVYEVENPISRRPKKK